jgi:hypothetical protein
LTTDFTDYPDFKKRIWSLYLVILESICAICVISGSFHYPGDKSP